MRYHLSTGKVVQVKFGHEYDENRRPHASWAEVECDGNLFTSDSLCHPQDQFRKRKGRLISFQKCITCIREMRFLDKQERAELFNLVFPNITAKSTRKKKKNRKKYEQMHFPVPTQQIVQTKDDKWICEEITEYNNQPCGFQETRGTVAKVLDSIKYYFGV